MNTSTNNSRKHTNRGLAFLITLSIIATTLLLPGCSKKQPYSDSTFLPSISTAPSSPTILTTDPDITEPEPASRYAQSPQELLDNYMEAANKCDYQLFVDTGGITNPILEIIGDIEEEQLQQPYETYMFYENEEFEYLKGEDFDDALYEINVSYLEDNPYDLAYNVSDITSIVKISFTLVETDGIVRETREAYIFAVETYDGWFATLFHLGSLSYTS